MDLKETLYDLTVSDLKKIRARVPTAGGSQRKDQLVAAISGYLFSDALAPLVASMPELERLAVAETVHNWNNQFDLVGFKAKYDAVPRFFTYTPYAFPDRLEPLAPTALELFFYHREIPADLAERLAALVPPPAAFSVATCDDDALPATIGDVKDGAEPLQRVDTELMVRADLPAVLRLVAQGGVAVGAKTGLASGAAIKRITALLSGGDWYAESEEIASPRWAGGPIRPIRAFAWPVLLQTGGLAKIDGSKLALTPKGKKALGQPLEEVIASLHGRWLAKGSPDELRRIDLIKGQTSKGVKLTPPAERRKVIIEAVCEGCPVGRWVAVDELFRLMKIDGYRFEIAGNPWKLYFSDANYGSLGYSGSVTFELLEARYTLAYLFEYLATLGLIDVAYTQPHGARPDYGNHWGTDEFDFLSRYDGLRYLRLNALGAYCLGLSDSYSPQLPERPPLLALEPDLSLRRLRPPEPAEQLQLEQIARAEGPERWSLDAAAILAQSASGPEERARIRDFLVGSMAEDTPKEHLAELDDWLGSLAERASALSDLGPARLIQCRDTALAAMLSKDPATAAHCSRAGDRLLCVPEKKLAAFRKGLAGLGFVLPELKP